MRHFGSQKDRREDAHANQTEAETVSVQRGEKKRLRVCFLCKRNIVFHIFEDMFVFQVCVRPFVVKHIENLPTFPAPSAGTLPSAGHMTEELEAEQEDKENVHNVRINNNLVPQLSSRLEERLSAVEARLERFSGLQRLSALERRLEDLEWQRNADRVRERGYPVSSWHFILVFVDALQLQERFNLVLAYFCFVIVLIF